jgi:hypothetical protein
MNMVMQAGLNQAKDQAQNLIPKEVKDGQNEEKKEGEGNNNSINDSQSNLTNSSNISHKKMKNKKINKQLAIKMYSVLLCHTGILTIAEYIIRTVQNSKGNVFDSDYNIVYWIIFAASIALALILSLLVTKIKCLSSMIFVSLFYVLILALDACIFNIGGHLLSFEVFVSMLIVFDAASAVILIFCSLIKDAPSLFWMICSSIGGIILAVFLCTKIYEDEKIFVLIFGVYAFVVYETMNYHVFDDGKKKKKKSEPQPQIQPQSQPQQEAKPEEEVKIPPMMVLPYEFNAAFVRLLLLIFKGIYTLIRGCCGGNKK